MKSLKTKLHCTRYELMIIIENEEKLKKLELDHKYRMFVKKYKTLLKFSKSIEKIGNKQQQKECLECLEAIKKITKCRRQNVSSELITSSPVSCKWSITMFTYPTNT